MFRFLIVTVLLYVSLDANIIVNKTKYNQALQAYKDKNYKLSYTLLDELLLKNLKNMKINYLLAKSAYNNGNFEIALSAYERIVIYDPDNTRVWYEIAKTYYMQKNYKKSQQIFLNLQKKNPPRDIKVNTNVYLLAIDKKIKKHLLSGTFIATLGYDSNINNRASDDTYDIPNGILTNTTEDLDELFMQEVLFLNYIYKYENNIHFKLNTMLFNKNVNNQNEKQIQLFSISPTLEYLSDNYSINYALIYDKIWADSSSYLSSYGINPSFDYSYNIRTKFFTKLKYIKKEYSDDINKYRDSKYIELLLSSSYIYTNNFLIKPFISFEKENKEAGNLTNVDYTAYSLGLSLNYKYSNTMSLLPSLKYKNKKYKDINSIFLKKQKDKQIKFDIAGIYIINKSLLSHINFNYTDVKSNLDSSQYNKYTATVSIIKSF